nr:hypothetical protein [Cytophagales bacterium]
MKNLPTTQLIDFLYAIKEKTLLITCMDFDSIVTLANNRQVILRTVLGMDLNGCCEQAISEIAALIKDQDIAQVILLAHSCCPVHEHLLTDFDSDARWADLANKIRENRLQLLEDGVSLLDCKQFVFGHAREQFHFLDNFLKNYCSTVAIKIPRTRCLVAESKFTFTELVRIEISAYKN